MNSKESILIVDDTRTNIDILVNLLDKYEIVVATSGDEALTILDKDENIDLILLDIMMPDMDGFEVCKIIKNNDKCKNIPIIFLTAKFDDLSIQEGLELGAVDYITKPFRPIELLARIKTHVKILNHEKKIVEYNKSIAIRELINNIAHQWRQPLSVISTASSSITLQKEMNILKDEDLLSYCNKITNNAEYLSKIIDNVSKMLEDKNELAQINIKSVFNRNSILFFGDVSDNNIDVNININSNIIINGNENKFVQILLAIIVNSKELLSSLDSTDKVILIDVTQNESHCHLSICDNGGGISSEFINRIFEPYFTTKYKSQDKGLGLFIVKKTIEELFKGTVSVSNIDFIYNDRKQKGASFDISIPLYNVDSINN